MLNDFIKRLRPGIKRFYIFGVAVIMGYIIVYTWYIPYMIIFIYILIIEIEEISEGDMYMEYQGMVPITLVFVVISGIFSFLYLMNSYGTWYKINAVYDNPSEKVTLKTVGDDHFLVYTDKNTTYSYNVIPDNDELKDAGLLDVDCNLTRIDRTQHMWRGSDSNETVYICWDPNKKTQSPVEINANGFYKSNCDIQYLYTHKKEGKYLGLGRCG